jgi:UTP--glucose-1-phosphate uridylyltransferase
VLQPEVMKVLGDIPRGAGGEIQLTDAMAALIGTQSFHGLVFDGERHDCGHMTGFVLANLALGLKRDDIAPAIRAFMAGM